MSTLKQREQSKENQFILQIVIVSSVDNDRKSMSPNIKTKQAVTTDHKKPTVKKRPL